MKNTIRTIGFAVIVMAIVSNANAQTAADLAGILGSDAKVKGSTVTFTGVFNIIENLTVPQGVTLDVSSKDAGIRLRNNGATLTVNGAIIARGTISSNSGDVPGAIQVEDGAAGVINGSGTITLKGKGRLISLWGGGKGQRLTIDGVTLVGVKSNNSTLVGLYENAVLTLKSGAITGNTSTVWDGGGVHMWKATFNMEGGTISGNSNSKEAGGGVKVTDGAVFTMTGGTISGNSATAQWMGGGGVEVWKATFNMRGGTISGNSVKLGSGAGVHIGEGGSFTMSGGTISGNKGIWGAGLQVRGTAAMSGGTITGNSAAAASGNAPCGSGVCLTDGGTFTMSGGEISLNTIQGGPGAGIAVCSKSTFTMEGGVISGNSAKGSGNNGGGLCVQDESTFVMRGGTIYGIASSLPAGVDASLANSSTAGSGALALFTNAKANWGTGRTYTKGGAAQSGGSGINSTDDTLIAR